MFDTNKLGLLAEIAASRPPDPPTPNLDLPAFPPLAGQSNVAMLGFTKREYLACELFAAKRDVRMLDDADLAEKCWRQAEAFFAADPRNADDSTADQAQYIADIEGDVQRARAAFATVVDAVFPEGLAEIETSRRVALTVERIREMRVNACSKLVNARARTFEAMQPGLETLRALLPEVPPADSILDGAAKEIVRLRHRELELLRERDAQEAGRRG